MRALKGNKKDLPAGLDPMEWANEVFTLMDKGMTEAEARRQVKENHKEQPDGN